MRVGNKPFGSPAYTRARGRRCEQSTIRKHKFYYRHSDTAQTWTMKCNNRPLRPCLQYMQIYFNVLLQFPVLIHLLVKIIPILRPTNNPIHVGGCLAGCTTNRTHLPRAPDVSIGKHKSVDKPSAVVRSRIRFNLSDSTTATSLPKTRVVYGKRDTTSSSPPVRCRCLFIRVYQRAIPVYQGETIRIKMTT